MSNVKLIFDAKKDAVNFAWGHYLEHPEMKKYLVHIKKDGGMYELKDSRTGDVVISSSMSLEHYLS